MRRLHLAALLLTALLPATVLNAQSQDILVRGSREQPSDWREAETDHVIVVSDGSEAELARIAHNLERLHFLLSVLLNRVDRPDNSVKLRVTLVGDSSEFNAMDLANLRAQEGPYASAFVMQRYYDPREDGAVMAASRHDGKALLDRGVALAGILPDLVRMTTAGATQPPGMAPLTGDSVSTVRFSGDDPSAIAVNEVSVPISAEGRIYAGYARHYLLTQFPNAYPRWYVDGFGEIFATIVAREDGQIDYGRVPEGYTRVVERYRGVRIGDVLTGRYLTDEAAAKRWTPFHAWALAHMLFFSETRRAQLNAYLAAVARGEPLDQAARAFGDLDQLQRELTAYDNGKMPFERMTYPVERAPEPIVRRLTRGEAAFVKGRLELGARLNIPPESADPKAAAARREAMRERDEWLARLRSDAARHPTNLEAQLLLAEAECRSGNADGCVAAANRALVIVPGNSDALAWKGTGQVQQALAGPAAERARRLKAARATIARANRADTESPIPLLAYYRSFADAGETPPDLAIIGLAKAVDAVPAAPGPRLMLGEALARRGDAAAARRALIPIANGAYDSPEAAKARALLASL